MKRNEARIALSTIDSLIDGEAQATDELAAMLQPIRDMLALEAKTDLATAAADELCHVCGRIVCENANDDVCIECLREGGA